MTYGPVLQSARWHAFDRWVATCNIILLVINVVWISWIERAMYVMTVASGLSLLMLGRRERESEKGSLAMLTLWHSLWHISLPLGLIFWFLYRRGHSTLSLAVCFVLGGLQLLVCASAVLCFPIDERAAPAQCEAKSVGAGIVTF